MTLLQWRDVTVDYTVGAEALPAVRGVTLSVERGEVLGIAGESGCGKSTLAATVLRLLPDSARVGGQVLLDGEDVLGMKWGRLRTVRWSEAAIVFQGALHSLNPVQNIGTQLAEPIRLHRSVPDDEINARVKELLEKVGLPASRASAYPHQLSGGQRQRVMIAMALACAPDLIIADEPTTALDVMVQAQVLDLLTSLVRDLGMGMVLISHDLGVLGTTCDRVAVMYAGEVVEEGPALEIFDSPRHEHTRALAAAFPRIGDPNARHVGDEAVASTAILGARDLRVVFGGRVRAVDGVNLEVDSGEIVALVGESGCGKTTLARTLLGLEKPTSGEVVFEGRPLDYRRLKDYRRQVQLVLQDPLGALNPRHTVYDAVAEGLRVHRVQGDEEALVAEALSKAGLRPPEKFFLRYPHELSGGQRQRVVIAGALALEPRVLIADEPVSSLDASVRGEILALLQRLRTELGLTVLVVTHDLGLAWNIADRVAVMYLGRIVEVGRTAQVLQSPQHPYTQALLSVVPDVGRTDQIVLQGEAPDPARIPSGCRFHPRCPVVLEECTTVTLPILGLESGHHAACVRVK
jgi:oligopeptide/dipeptide ABC transporter ATP-binding protein